MTLAMMIAPPRTMPGGLIYCGGHMPGIAAAMTHAARAMAPRRDHLCRLEEFRIRWPPSAWQQ